MKNSKTKMRLVMQKCVWSLSILGVVIGIAIATLTVSPANTQAAQNLQFDVFIDANTIYFSGPGEWTCRGTFTRNASETRPEVFTIQEFYLPDDTTAIATEGIEHGLVGPDHRDMRATIGGTGIYQNVKGQNTEVRIGVNGTGLFNISFTFTH